jgi:Rrf2 family protein
MINATTELAIKWLVYLAVLDSNAPLSPKRGAETLDCSPSYLAKTSNLLVKAGILRSIRGIRGGVVLARPPEEITLLEIVEATEGLVTANYCRETNRQSEVCSFHEAMKELHSETTRVLSQWTLRKLLAHPARCLEAGGRPCRMAFKKSDQQ